MNKDIIHKAIANPELTLNTGVEDLEKISAQYPFFGAAQLLLTKAYLRTNDYRYTDQLHQAAIYSTDRKHLYNWIKENATAPDVELPKEVAFEPELKVESAVLVEEKTDLEEPISDSSEGLETSSSEVIIPSSENVADLVSLMLGDEQKEKINTPLHQDRVEAELPITQPEHKHEEIIETAKHEITEVNDIEQHVPTSTKASASNLDAIEKEILLEAMQSSIELEVSEGVDELEIEPLEQSTDNAAEENVENGSYAAWIFGRSQAVHFSENSRDKPGEAEPIAVSDWQRNVPIAAEEESEEVEQDEEIPLETPRHLSHGIKKLTPSAQGNSQQNIIDRFIKFEPKITPGKALEYTAGNLAKESLEEDLSFVTETMAILFAKQGKPDKARRAFKKLIELHPEKSVYFAAQLKNLDKFKK